jgi:hypothetical protein
MLTGLALIGGSYLLSHRLWVMAIAALPVLAWMGYFLLMFPKLWQQAMAEAAQVKKDEAIGRE